MKAKWTSYCTTVCFLCVIWNIQLNETYKGNILQCLSTSNRKTWNKSNHLEQAQMMSSSFVLLSPRHLHRQGKKIIMHANVTEPIISAWLTCTLKFIWNQKNNRARVKFPFLFLLSWLWVNLIKIIHCYQSQQPNVTFRQKQNEIIK